MKQDKQRLVVDRRLIGLAGAGFLLGRVWLFRINPFAVAFFAAMCAERRGRKAVALAALCGMLSSMEGISLLKYMLLFSVVLCAEHWRKEDGRQIKNAPLAMALLCGGLNLLLGAVNSILAVNSWEMFWLSVLESAAVLALANVYQWGVRFFLYEDWRKIPENEELISILALVFTALYGIPSEADAIFSVVGTISYFLVLFAGYRYGAAVGALTGAAGGVLAAVSGRGMVMIGLYCLLGVSVGMFRQLGKVCAGLAFFLMGCVLVYGARFEIEGIIELRAMVSAVIIFFAIPGKILCVTEEGGEEERNTFAREDIRDLASSKIEDFSDAFRRLSKSFEAGGTEQRKISTEEVEKAFEELSEKICSSCANCNYCWDRHFEETSLNIHNLLWQAGRDGSVTMEKISPDFGRRCIRLASYMESAEEKMASVRSALGWRNRLAENREIMARQMREVAGALKSFTLDLEDTEDVPVSLKKQMAEELKKEGVRLRRLSAKYRKKRMEVVFSGYCRGNRCLTKTDIARALGRAAGVYMCPARETRNVLSSREETMFFREDTRYKALTGLARVAKSGEMVSGDNYSFLELQSGELVMVLADGMGSGAAAYRDSGNLIEVLEHLMEAGFEKKSALRLLNTLFVANYEGATFTTLDMVSIDLHTGRCEIMKSGAAATFIRRADRVETILSEALPVGVDMEAESDVTALDVGEGDMVIMVSDGVIDGFYGGEPPEGEDTLEALIESLTCQNPNDMANQILMNTLARSSREATDDMSVLVAGIWNKI